MGLRELPKIKFSSSWDDGGKLDLRLAEILKKYDLPATFFIPSCCDLDEYQIVQLSKNFEIGGHTVSHFQDLKQLDDSTLFYEIADNKTWLEDLIGKPIDQFCYPRGRYDERVKEAVKKCGFKSARTTIVCKTESADQFKTDTTIHVFQRDEYRGVDWAEAAREWAKKASDNGGIFHIWGHSKEINKFDNWEKLDDFFRWLIKNFEIIK